MTKLIDFQIAFDRAVKVYFDCEDEEYKHILAFFLNVARENLASTEVILSDISNARKGKILSDYKRRQKSLLQEMVAGFTRLSENI